MTVEETMVKMNWTVLSSQTGEEKSASGILMFIDVMCVTHHKHVWCFENRERTLYLNQKS